MTSDAELRAKPILSRNPSWRRIFCQWWGHEWVMTRNFTAPKYQQWSCLRCYACVYLGDPWREGQ